MKHTLEFDAEDGQFVRFKCSTCGAVCNFDTLGEPAPVKTADGWTPPEDPEQWMGACDAA